MSGFHLNFHLCTFIGDPEALRDYTSLYPNDIGAITSIQRFNDALSLYPHFHTLVSDGLFVTSDPPFDLWNRSAQEQVTDVTFHQTREPTNTDLLDILIHVRYRLIKRFIYKGYLRGCFKRVGQTIIG